MEKDITERKRKVIKKRKIVFDVYGAKIVGWFISVDNEYVTVRVISDSYNLAVEGTYVNYHKCHIDDYEDLLYVEKKEYQNLNFIQKIFGKRYLGIPLLILIISLITMVLC